MARQQQGPGLADPSFDLGIGPPANQLDPPASTGDADLAFDRRTAFTVADQHDRNARIPSRHRRDCSRDLNLPLLRAEAPDAEQPGAHRRHSRRIGIDGQVDTTGHKPDPAMQMLRQMCA